MKLYLDMDGVLVDFLGHVEKCQFFRKNGKVDWDKVIEKGPQFWNEMGWIPGAEKAFNELLSLSKAGKFELYILSAINFPSGVEGKKLWIQNHINFQLEKTIIVSHSVDKAKYASPNSVLVDDREQCLTPFKEAGGKIIPFKNWEECISEIKTIIK